MKEERSPVSSYLAINEDEKIVVSTLTTDQHRIGKKVRIADRASQSEVGNSQEKVETTPLTKNEDEDGEEGIAVLPVAGLFLLILKNKIIFLFEILRIHQVKKVQARCLSQLVLVGRLY